MKTVTLKHWAWVRTDDSKYPIISIDETKDIVASEKREKLYGRQKLNGVLIKKEYSDEICKMNRMLYRKSKVVPIEITYNL